ncbi:hypothetical protein [Streptomyces sp. NPDC055912]|uniref:hypothetical protein n=1 Tax=Streptomyces TaxID=1883 RepID=UPI0035D74127
MSVDQLRRWRRARLLPANERAWGGPGSTSRTPATAQVIAQALALEARRGRSIHETALRVYTSRPHVPLSHDGIAPSLVWWITRRDDGPDRRIEQAFEDATTEDEGIEAALAIAKRTVRTRKPLPGRVGAPDEAQRQFMDAYARMLLGKVLGSAIVGSDHQMAMFDVWAARLSQLKDNLPYSADELRLMGQEMAVSFDLNGAADDPPLPLKWRREADLALVQSVNATALLWTRNALALLDRAANILEVGAEAVPNDPVVAAVDAIDESDEDAHVSASYALSSIARPQWLRGGGSDRWARALYRLLDGCRDNRLPGGQADLQTTMGALESVMLALPELVERIYRSWPVDQLETRDSRSTLDPEIRELNMLIDSTYRADPLSRRS